MSINADLILQKSDRFSGAAGYGSTAYSDWSKTTELLKEALSQAPSLFGRDDQGINQKQPGIADAAVMGGGRSALGQIAESKKINLSTTGVSAGAMMRNSENKVTDGAKVAGQRISGKQQIHDQKAQAQEAYKDVQKQAVNELKDVAAEQGMNADSAAKQIGPKHETSKGEVAMGMMGAGSFVTFGCAAVGAGEVLKGSKSLSSKQKQSLIDDAYAKTQSSGPSAQDSRASASGPVSLFATKPRDPNVEILKDMDRTQFEDVLTKNVEDDPMFQKLDDAEKALDGVQGNHKFISQNHKLAQTHDSIQVSLAGDSIRELSVPEAPAPHMPAAHEIGVMNKYDAALRMDTPNLSSQFRV